MINFLFLSSGREESYIEHSVITTTCIQGTLKFDWLTDCRSGCCMIGINSQAHLGAVTTILNHGTNVQY